MALGSPRKVAHVIIKAREYDVKVGPGTIHARTVTRRRDPSAILEDYANDPTRAELLGSSSV